MPRRRIGDELALVLTLFWPVQWKRKLALHTASGALGSLPSLTAFRTNGGFPAEPRWRMVRQGL
ncbi:hypothetical protein RV134_220005 [Roseovarius sp. EC-HK134]|nr:hypothetical protein RV134_220005 [Roseovarius sp. EC-HK134]VVT02298.1 hypothetical protein RV420_260132 [Roseovarius sp. EC-SD190]